MICSTSIFIHIYIYIYLFKIRIHDICIQSPSSPSLWPRSLAPRVDLGIAAFCVLVRLWTVRTLSPLIQDMVLLRWLLLWILLLILGLIIVIPLLVVYFGCFIGIIIGMVCWSVVSSILIPIPILISDHYHYHYCVLSLAKNQAAKWYLDGPTP